MSEEYTQEQLLEIEAMRLNACSYKGLLFIVQQVAELNEGSILLKDLLPIIAQARFAVKAVEELTVDSASDCRE